MPAVKSEEVDINGDTAHLHDNEAPPTRLAWFLLGVLRVTVETQLQLERRPGRHPQPLLPQLLGRCLLLLSSLLSGLSHRFYAFTLQHACSISTFTAIFMSYSRY